MLKAVCWVCGLALLVGYWTTNASGYCIPQATRFSHEEAILFTLHDAANSRSYIIPKIATLDEARDYLKENPDCCSASPNKRPFEIHSLFGLHRGAYQILLPSTGGPENLYSEFTYVLSNCLRIREIWKIGHIKE